jgi:hypothetical protein
MHYQRPCASMPLCTRRQWQVLHSLHLGNPYTAAMGNGPGRTHWTGYAALAACVAYVYRLDRLLLFSVLRIE